MDSEKGYDSAQSFLEGYKHYDLIAARLEAEHLKQCELITELQNVLPLRRDYDNLRKRVNDASKRAARLPEDRDRAILKREEIGAAIDSLSGIEHDIIKLLYIDRVKWETAAERINYSMNGLQRHRKKALEKIETRLKK